jgi:fructose-1,6-bisphosphatase
LIRPPPSVSQWRIGPPHSLTLPLLPPQAAPFGLLVEKAGGLTSDGVSGGSVLDVPITGIDQRTALCLGSADEVKRFNTMVLGK